MSTSFKRIVPAALVLGSLAAGTVVAARPGAPAPPKSEAAAIPELPDPVASIGGEPVTRAELDERLAPVMSELRQQLYQIREQALDQLVAERLLDAEATKKGVTVDELVQSEVFAKLAKPTDAEVQAFYEQNKAQIGEVPLDVVRPQIEQALQQQAAGAAIEAYLDQLEQAADVKVFLEPPRQEVHVDGDPRIGPKDAKVTVVEFSDFECPYCAQATDTVHALAEKYGDDVAVVFKNYPLPMHASAQKAAEAGECALDQGKFWELHDKVFANQAQMGVEQLVVYAGELGMDVPKFEQCLTSGEKADEVAADLAAGQAVGVTGTPSFLVNGRMVTGAPTVEEISRIIEQELAQGAKKGS